MSLDARGLGLIEVLMVSALLTVVALGATAVVNNTLNANKVAASRAVNAALSDALRTQLSRRSTCASNIVTPPATYGADSDVAVTIGNTRVQAGANLADYRLKVKSLAIRDVTWYGSTTSGNNVFFANLKLQTQSSPLESGGSYEFREVVAARLTLEVQGANTLVGCYASDPASDQAQQLSQLCAAVASTDRRAGFWSGGRCVAQDDGGPTKCAQMGGSWTGSRCSITPQTFFVNRVIGYGAAGNTYYGAICPAGSSVTGVACYATNGPLPAVNTALLGNGAYCWWASGNETTQFVVQASCAP